MTKTKAKGFTLIELAIVIAIVGILAAAAIPRFGDLTRNAQRAVFQDFVAQLNSAAASYTAENARTPTSFSQFVTHNPTLVGTAAPGGGLFTIAFPRTAAGVSLCGAALPANALVITCNFNPPGGAGFNTATYNWTNGSIRLTFA